MQFIHELTGERADLRDELQEAEDRVNELITGYLGGYGAGPAVPLLQRTDETYGLAETVLEKSHPELFRRRNVLLLRVRTIDRTVAEKTTRLANARNGLSQIEIDISRLLYLRELGIEIGPVSFLRAMLCIREWLCTA